VPYHSYEIDAATGGDSAESGLGDATIVASWWPWAGMEDPADPFDLRRISFIGGFRLPTGESDLDRFEGAGGEVVPLGSGTTDLILGTATTAPLSKEWRLFNSLIFSIPFDENDDEPPPGTFLGTKDAFSIFDRLGASLAAGEFADVYAAVDFLWKDRAEGTAVSEDDGGTFFWLTLGTLIKVGGAGSIEASIQIPLGDGHPVAALEFWVGL
jgi:hypothetical protein